MGTEGNRNEPNVPGPQVSPGSEKQRSAAPEKVTVPIGTTRVALAPTSSEQRRVSLLLYHREGAQAVPLTAGIGVVVGREPPSDVFLSDPNLSRRHARFTLSNGKVTVEDLGSTNGTWLNGQRVEGAVLAPGDEVVLGGVRVSVHVLESGSLRPSGLESHDRFRAALDFEIARAAYFGRKVSVVMLRAAHVEHDGHVRHWHPRIQPLLRPVDRVALYSADSLEILLPEVGLEAAIETAKTLVATSPTLLAGVGSHPDSAASAEELIDLVRRAALRAKPVEPVVAAGSEAPAEGPSSDEAPVSRTAVMRSVMLTASRLAKAVIPVLIQGETGTGKEVLARFMHEQGSRRAGRMVCVNCGAIPSQLVESTLFGHERGAFTGANQRLKGVFESADGGTVLLDEVGELPAAAQAALLRVLETKRVTRVGSNEETEVDVRVLAATHRDLESMCDTGAFRRDLLYRLNAMTIRLPALRERREDIPALAAQFLAQASAANGVDVREIDDDAMLLLKGYDWPGNVRELRNAIERAVVIAEGTSVTIDDLPEQVRGATPMREEARATPSEPPRTEADAPPEDFRVQVDRFEVSVIVDALRHANWNQTEAARRLGLPLRTLVYKIRAHGIRKLGFGTERG